MALVEESLGGALAKAVGAVATKAGTTDIVDACLVEGALRRRDLVVTSDPGDLEAIAGFVDRRLEVERP